MHVCFVWVSLFSFASVAGGSRRVNSKPLKYMQPGTWKWVSFSFARQLSPRRDSSESGGLYIILCQDEARPWCTTLYTCGSLPLSHRCIIAFVPDGNAVHYFWAWLCSKLVHYIGNSVTKTVCRSVSSYGQNLNILWMKLTLANKCTKFEVYIEFLSLRFSWKQCYSMSITTVTMSELRNIQWQLTDTYVLNISICTLEPRNVYLNC